LARTKAVDYDLKRAAILATAARLFAEEGYYQSSMASLAAECGISKALLYHYYDSKDALLYDVIGEHLRELCTVVEQADDPGKEPERRLHGLVTALLQTYAHADDHHRVQINAMKFLPRHQQEELKDLERRLVDRFADALSEINPRLDSGAGLLKPVTMSLFGMLNWHYMWFRDDGTMTRDNYADICTRLIVEGARALR
jgi:TetR/AcrR family transcriptional regulator